MLDERWRAAAEAQAMHGSMHEHLVYTGVLARVVLHNRKAPGCVPRAQDSPNKPVRCQIPFLEKPAAANPRTTCPKRCPGCTWIRPRILPDSFQTIPRLLADPSGKTTLLGRSACTPMLARMYSCAPPGFCSTSGRRPDASPDSLRTLTGILPELLRGSPATNTLVIHKVDDIDWQGLGKVWSHAGLNRGPYGY